MAVEELYNSHTVSGAAWSPGGGEVAFTSDLSGRINIWKVRASGGRPIQLTRSDESQSNPVWSPDGKWIVYEEDHAGNQINDLYAISADGGELFNLTQTASVDEWGSRWPHNGRMIAFSRKPKQGVSWDLAVMDWTTHAIHQLTDERQPACTWTAVAWSGDDKFIFANRTNFATNDADV